MASQVDRFVCPECGLSTMTPSGDCLNCGFEENDLDLFRYGYQPDGLLWHDTADDDEENSEEESLEDINDLTEDEPSNE